MPRDGTKHESMHDAGYLPDASHMSMGKLPDLAANGAMSGASTLPPGAENIVIKNHFPVARIKRIMQADDDVGKVAQVTPVVVCTSCPSPALFSPHTPACRHTNLTTAKALELFMISLVSRAAAEAKSRNSKRVGAIHLKQAITKNEQFDFLNDIVSKVADAPEKSEDPGDAEGKKRKTPGRRKKKTDDDDDF